MTLEQSFKGKSRIFQIEISGERVIRVRGNQGEKKHGALTRVQCVRTGNNSVLVSASVSRDARTGVRLEGLFFMSRQSRAFL